jgi:hypothetical protein
MGNSNWLLLLCSTSTEYFVLLLTIISVKYYECVCLYSCIGYPGYLLSHIISLCVACVAVPYIISLCVACVAVPYITTLPYKR